MTADCVYTTDMYLDKDGYPMVKWKKRHWRLNRLIYTFVHGSVPKGMVVGHSCNNKGCINSKHLYVCTPAENSSHAARDGLYKTGFVNKDYEDASDDWKTICDMYHIMNMSQREIGDIYNISQPRVSDILKKYTRLFLIGDER